MLSVFQVCQKPLRISNVFFLCYAGGKVLIHMHECIMKKQQLCPVVCCSVFIFQGSKSNWSFGAGQGGGGGGVYSCMCVKTVLPACWQKKNCRNVVSLKSHLSTGGSSDSNFPYSDRSETAKFLIEQGSPAGVGDDCGVSAMTLMISKMPPVAKEALDQFHTTDRANRKQFFYLNYLEPYTTDSRCSTCARSPLQVVVLYKQMELIMHPVFQRLIDVKWDLFGRRGVILQVVVQLLFVLLFTALGVTLHIGQDSNYYYPPRDFWWRIVLETFACSMTVYFVLLELLEIRASNRSHQKWQKWRIRELEKDLNFTHPRWPEERKYLEMEIRNIADSGISYFNDAWNYFDWITYAWVLSIVITRLLSVGWGSSIAKSLHPKVFALALIFIWLRLMKVFRAFVSLGPFIVMIGSIIDDTLKFAFLYFEFFIPYVCAFWIVFGGAKNAQIVEEGGESTDGIKVRTAWTFAKGQDARCNDARHKCATFRHLISPHKHKIVRRESDKPIPVCYATITKCRGNWLGWD